MGFIDKIFKKKQKSKTGDDYLDLIEDELNYDNEESNNKGNTNNEIEVDFDKEEASSIDTKKSKNKMPNLNFNLGGSKKNLKIIGGVTILGLSLFLASPMVINMLNTSGIMSNSEYNEVVKEVEELSNNDDLMLKTEQEEKDKLAKAKADREAKKLKKEQENNSLVQNEETKQEFVQNEKPIVKEVKDTFAEETLKVEKPINNINSIDKEVSITQNENKISTTETKEEDLAIGKRFVGKDGNIQNEKIEKSMEEQFNKSMSKIEQSNLEHDVKDELDPFALEYNGTINSKAMSNELIENVKLMKEYITFLETKKQFEEAKLTFEQKKRKNLFEDEVNKVKGEVLIELDGLKKELSNLKQDNNNLTSKLVNNSKDQELENLKNLDNEIANRKMELTSDVSQKVYKIGFNYLLEETDSEGNIKVYRDGNAYKGYKIVQITPDFLKVKQDNGKITILSINEENNIKSGYSKVSIPTPQKVEVENDSSNNSSSNSSNSNKKVENYSNVQNKSRENMLNEQKNIENNRENQLKSRFLN